MGSCLVGWAPIAENINWGRGLCFSPVLQAGLFPLFQPPPQTVCCHLLSQWKGRESAGHYSHSTISKASWIAFSSAIWRGLLQYLCDLLCRTPCSRFPFSVYPYSMAGTISRESILLFIFFQPITWWDIFSLSLSPPLTKMMMKFSSLGQFLMASKIPGQLCFLFELTVWSVQSTYST